MRGRIAAYEGDFDGAIEQFRAAAVAAPKEAAIRIALVDVLLRDGQKRMALAESEAAQQRWPNESRVWMVSGRTYHRSGRYRSAVRAYQRALQLDGRYESAHLGLADSWAALARPDRVEETLRQLVAVAPHSVAGNFRLGRRLLANDRADEAIEFLERAHNGAPNDLKILVALARAQRARGDRRASVAVLRSAFDRSYGDPEVGRELFVELLELGDRGSAVRLLDDLHRDDLEIDTRLSFGYLFLRVGEFERALAVAAKLRANHPKNSEIRLLEANALVGLRKDAAAIETLVAVTPGRAAYARARAFAAEIAVRSGDLARAEEILAPAVEVMPEQIDLIIARARIRELAGDIKAARELLGAALGGEEDEALRFALADLEDRAGNHQKSLAVVEPLLRSRRSAAGALNYIGYSLADRGVELPRARRLLQKALELEPDSSYVLDSWGWLQFREKRFPLAREALERAARLSPAEPEILWHLAEVLLAVGNKPACLRLLQRARSLSIDPGLERRIDARLRALAGQR